MNTAISQHLDWIAVDWGSSNLRAWALDKQGNVLASNSSEKGMLALSPADYEAELYRVVDGWLPANRPITVMVCGMAGARQGWQEAAYLATPTRLDQLSQGAVMPPLSNPRLRVYLLPGLSQNASANFDVMRGEECQLAGLVAQTPGLNGLVCLPGTHAKWATLVDGAVSHFATFLTGELYQLLAQQSVLKHSIGKDSLNEQACKEAFVTAVQQANEAPQTFSNRLFQLRAQDLLDNSLPSGQARSGVLAARLSGLAIGLELAGACEQVAPGEPITLIGNDTLCQRYALALEALGYHCHLMDGEAAVLAGLALAYRTLTP